MKRLAPILVLILLLAACTGKTSQPAGPSGTTPAAMSLTSPNFVQGEAIPSLYTCQGEDSSPALEWSSPPPGTKSLALIVEDPDTPIGTYTHWLVYNLPPEVRELPEGASKAKAGEFNLPVGTLQGLTSFKRSDYGGPCPPYGTHRYFFYLYALDISLDSPGLSQSGLSEAMQGHVLARGELMGTYQKK